MSTCNCKVAERRRLGARPSDCKGTHSHAGIRDRERKREEGPALPQKHKQQQQHNNKTVVCVCVGDAIYYAQFVGNEINPNPTPTTYTLRSGHSPHHRRATQRHGLGPGRHRAASMPTLASPATAPCHWCTGHKTSTCNCKIAGIDQSTSESGRVSE